MIGNISLHVFKFPQNHRYINSRAVCTNQYRVIIKKMKLCYYVIMYILCREATEMLMHVLLLLLLLLLAKLSFIVSCTFRVFLDIDYI